MSTPGMKPDHTIDDLLDSLVVRASRLGLSKRELARRAKLHFNTLTAFGRKNWSPGVSVLRRIERALQEAEQSGAKSRTAALAAASDPSRARDRPAPRDTAASQS